MKQMLSGVGFFLARPKDEDDRLVYTLEEKGGIVYSFPMIKISPPSTYEGLDGAISNLSQVEWIIFLSANGVRAFKERLELKENKIPLLKGSAIGEETARAMKKVGLPVDIIPSRSTSEGLIQALSQFSWEGKKVLVVQAEDGRSQVCDWLKIKGAEVTFAAAYRTKLPSADYGPLLSLLEQQKIHVAIFTSPSQVQNFSTLLLREGSRQKQLVEEIAGVAIGPVTGAEMKKLPFFKYFHAKEQNHAGILRIIEEYWEGQR